MAHRMNFGRRAGIVCGLAAALAAAAPAIGGGTGTVVYEEDFESPPFVAGPLHMQGGWVANPIVTLETVVPGMSGFDFGSLSMRVPPLSTFMGSNQLSFSPMFQRAFGEFSLDIDTASIPFIFLPDTISLDLVDTVANAIVVRIQVNAGDFIRVRAKGGWVQTNFVLAEGYTIRLRIHMPPDGTLTIWANDFLIFEGVTLAVDPGFPTEGIDRFQFADLSAGGGEYGTIIVDNIRFVAEFPCPADLNGDGVVSGADLAQVLGSWGACGESSPGYTQDVLVDDFSADMGWTVGAPGDTTPMNGIWERAAPAASFSQPGEDATPGDDTLCYITGAEGGPNNSDVDGQTTLTSPLFDATAPTPSEAFISCKYWFYSSDPDQPTSDSLDVFISNDDGASWTLVEALSQNTTEWTSFTRRVNDYVTPTSTMRLRFVANDRDGDDLVDAAVDDVRVFVDVAAIDGACPADFTNDGVVNAADLSILLGGWGACP